MITFFGNPERDSDLEGALAALKRSMQKNRALVRQIQQELASQSEMAQSMEKLIRLRGRRTDNQYDAVKPEPAYQTVLMQARKFMIVEGRPLDRLEVLSKLIENGFELRVSNPAHFVGKTLWASADFIPSNKGYWPSDLPLPPGIVASQRRRPQKRNK